MIKETIRTAPGKGVSAIVLASIGLASLGLQPILVSALIERSGLSAGASGYVASAEVFGIAVTNAAAAIAGSRISWRRTCAAGLILMLCGNVFSPAAGGDAVLLMVSRFLSGLGSGLLISRGYAAAGLTGNPDRMLGYVLAASTAHIALGSLVLPTLVTKIGPDAIFFYFAALAVTGLAFVGRMPTGATPSIRAHNASSTLSERSSALASAALLFLGLGMLWPYLFQIGLNMGASVDQAALGLTVSQIAAFLGALVAALSGRLMPALEMHIGALLVTIVSIAMLPFASGGMAYAALASGFNGASNTAMVLALGAVALSDVDGRWIAAAVTSQTLGFALGPALAATIVGEGGYAVVQLCSAALVGLSAVGAIVAATLKRRREPRAG